MKIIVYIYVENSTKQRADYQKAIAFVKERMD
jgi:hypothetical protein